MSVSVESPDDFPAQDIHDKQDEVRRGHGHEAAVPVQLHGGNLGLQTHAAQLGQLGEMPELDPSAVVTCHSQLERTIRDLLKGQRCDIN